jgi:hypothetical protein
MRGFAAVVANIFMLLLIFFNPADLEHVVP